MRINAPQTEMDQSQMSPDVQILDGIDEPAIRHPHLEGRLNPGPPLPVIAGTLFDSLCKTGYREFQNPIAVGSVGGIVDLSQDVTDVAEFDQLLGIAAPRILSITLSMSMVQLMSMAQSILSLILMFVPMTLTFALVPMPVS